MPIVLRSRVTIPVFVDGEQVDQEFATVAFVDGSGQQYAQLNVEASEVEGIEDGASLILTEGGEIAFAVPSDHATAIMRGDLVVDLS